MSIAPTINDGRVTATIVINYLIMALNLRHYVALHYATMLAHLLRKQLIPDFWISEASITIDFNVNAEHEHLNECSTSGEPFTVGGTLMRSKGKNHSAEIVINS